MKWSGLEPRAPSLACIRQLPKPRRTNQLRERITQSYSDVFCFSKPSANRSVELWKEKDWKGIKNIPTDRISLWWERSWSESGQEHDSFRSAASHQSAPCISTWLGHWNASMQNTWFFLVFLFGGPRRVEVSNQFLIQISRSSSSNSSCSCCSSSSSSSRSSRSSSSRSSSISTTCGPYPASRFAIVPQEITHFWKWRWLNTKSLEISTYHLLSFAHMKVALECPAFNMCLTMALNLSITSWSCEHKRGGRGPQCFCIWASYQCCENRAVMWLHHALPLYHALPLRIKGRPWDMSKCSQACTELACRHQEQWQRSDGVVDNPKDISKRVS